MASLPKKFPKNFQSQFKFVFAVSFITVLVGIAWYSMGEAVVGNGGGETGSETGKAVAEAVIDFEGSCRLNSFSWITRQPERAGVALSEEPCLGCTVDVANHFCRGKDEAEYSRFVAALADFRSSCKANGNVWMLMEPMRNNVTLSEKLCWGCMADEQNHFCSKQEYLRFEGESINAT